MRLHNHSLEFYLHLHKQIKNSSRKEDELKEELYKEAVVKYVISKAHYTPLLKDVIFNENVTLESLSCILVEDYLKRNKSFEKKWTEWNEIQNLEEYLVGQSSWFIKKNKLGLYENNFDETSTRHQIMEIYRFFGKYGAFDYKRLNSLIIGAKNIDSDIDLFRKNLINQL